MNIKKGNHFQHNKKQQKHPSQGGGRSQWPGQQVNRDPKSNPGQQHDKPQWPGQKDKC